MAVLLMPGLTLWTTPAKANPAGGVVVHGDVKIGPGTGGNLQIRQNSRNAIINWNSFSINAGELTQFRQPGSTAAVLNRVTGGDPTAIHGALKANGNVFVINPNGILVGPGGTIDVHGLALSTLDVSNGEFLAGGDMVFKGAGDKGVTNLGRINAVGGDVFLIGKTVSNSGSIHAEGGRVGLAAGEEVLLTAAESGSGERIFVRAKGSGVSGTGVYNDGTIEGAAVEMKAHGNIYALAINNKGSVRATGASHSGGRVFLRGVGGAVSNSGSIRATSSGSGNSARVLIEAAYAKVDGMIRAQGGEVRLSASDKAEVVGRIDVSSTSGKGGEVVVEGREIDLQTGSLVDASGQTGGGNVRIGGGFQGRDQTIVNADTLAVADGAVIRSDAYSSGRGGNVILWADGDTVFEGEVSARGVSGGGFAEISGKQNLGFDGEVDLTATSGPAGTLLLDPTNVTIGPAAASASHINNLALSNALDLGNNVIISTNFGVAGPRGDITVLAGTAASIGQNAGGIEWYQQDAVTVGGTLSLLATGNILFANDVRSAGAGGINIVAGWDGGTGIVDPLSGGAETIVDPLSATIPGSFDMAAVLATMNNGDPNDDAAGLNGGSVFINGYDINGAVSNAVTEGVEVGSRYGATQVAAHDLLIRGSNGGQRWAQLGFRDSGVEFGLNFSIAIGTQNGERNEWWGSNGAADGSGGATQWGNIQNKDYIALLGGTVESGGAFRGAGYGAGGLAVLPGEPLSGSIVVNVSGRIDLRGGDSGNAAAQIGHGGLSAEGVETNRNVGGAPAGAVTTRDGAVIDVVDNNRAFFGATWRTNHVGNAARVDAPISLLSGEDILAMAPSTFETIAGFTDLTNDEANGNRYAKIGHGGLDNFGSYHGDISVIALGATTAGDGRGLAGAGIQLRGGLGSLNIAQIGHGGFHEGNHRAIWDQTSSGNVTVRAETGAVRVLGFNLLPRTGDRNAGAYVGLNDILPAGSANDQEVEFGNVQIGHGGWHRSRVVSGSFTPPAGVAASVLPDQSMAGNIGVYAGGTVQVRDNMGFDSAGNWTPDPGPGIDPILQAGGILRDVGIEVRAGNGGWYYGQIGHGGVNMNNNTGGGASPGTIWGDIRLEAAAGSILGVGGEEKRSQRDWGVAGNFVQVGHGGYDSDAMNANGFQGSITVLAGQGGMNGLGQAVTPVDGDLIFRTGRMGESWAMIGHGGRSSSGNVTGDALSSIAVTARDAIEFSGRISGPTDAPRLSTDYYQVNVLNSAGTGGDGNAWTGQSGTTVDEDTRPQTTTRGLAYNVDIKFAQIGHGGYDFIADNQPTQYFSFNNTINVAAQTGGIRFTASDADNDFIMIGMGGLDGANQRGIGGANITVSARDDIFFDARSSGTLETNRIPIGGADRMESRPMSRGLRTFAMIGNGGYDVDGDFSGDVRVTTTHGNLYMLGATPKAVNTVTGYVGNTVEGPALSSGSIGSVVGTPHLFTALQEATMKARSFTLFHGTAGAAPAAFQGAIVPGTVRIDTNVDPDLGDYDSDGNLRRTSGGAILGTIDYATGVVTIFERVQTDDNAVNRNVDYSYTLPSSTVQNIQDERTPESDSALFATQAYLGHGGIVPGTLSIVIDPNNAGGGRQVVSDWFGNGVLYNDKQLRVGSIDYNSGRVIIEGVNTATGDGNADGGWDLGTPIEQRAPLNSRTSPDPVVANYQYTAGNPDQAFVQLGNGGYSAAVGGVYSPGHSGEIVANAPMGDIRLHGGAYNGSYVQLGHGGRDSQGWHGYQTDQVDRANPDFGAIDADGKGNITVTAGGILEFLAGRGISYWDNNQYAQLGHGGYNADGHHQGNIRVTSGLGAVSVSPGVIGGSGQTGGVIFTAGQSRDAYAQLGHGGFGARSERAAGDAGGRGLTGHIVLNTTGDVRFTSGTNLSNYQDLEDGRIVSQLGHGGYDADIRQDGGTQLRGTGIGHAGDITVTTTQGGVYFRAGDENLVVPGGGTLGQGYGIIHYSHLGHGGYSAQGDHHGNITVTARDDISFVGGSRTTDDSTDKRNYVMLGHGGDESDGSNGARDLAGNALDTISVTSTAGDIEFMAGEGRRNFAHLGMGGFQNNGDQIANIALNAAGNIHFVGGQGSADWMNDSSRSLDTATWAAGTGGGGWVSLRYRDVRFWNTGVAAAGLNFTITVAGNSYIATRATVQEANNASSFTAANIIAPADVDLNGDTVVDIAAGTAVGEINLRTGHVRFFQDLDPNATGQVTASYAVTTSTTVNVGTSVENSTTNPMLAQAVRGPANFLGSSPHLQATFNNTRGGLNNVTQDPAAPFADNIGIAAGTFRLNVPDGTVVVDNGGILEVQAAAVGSGLAVGQSVGSINYLRGQIVLDAVVNPGGLNGVTANYQADRPIGSDFSYAQLGNGGYNADVPDGGGPPGGGAFSVSNRGNVTVSAGGDVRFHAGNGAIAYAQLGHGGDSNHGGNTGDLTVNSQGVVEFLAGLGADLTDSRNYAQLGHGGYDGDGNHSGHIVVNAGSGTVSLQPGILGGGAASAGLNFRGGQTDQAYVQLGHGGYGARSGNGTGAANAVGLTGNITVVADGSVHFTAGTFRRFLPVNNDGAAYALLGHGGLEADTTSDGVVVTGNGIGHNGNILVRSVSGGVEFNAGSLQNGSSGTGDGRFQFAQLGHGGYATNGNHFGNIFVEAGQDIVFRGGTSGSHNASETISYAQLGHGGRSSEGNMGSRDGGGNATETIRVLSLGNISFLGGVGQENYAQLGNGGRAARGDHAANIQVLAGESVTFMGSQSDHLAGTGITGRNHYLSTNVSANQNLNDAADATLGSAFLWNQKVVPGTLVLSLATDAAATALGTTFTDTRDTPTSLTGTIRAADSTVVGTINYVTGAITFTQTLHTGTAASQNLVARYEHTDAGLAYVQMGNGGYDADTGGAGSVGNVGDLSVGAATGNLTFRAGNDDQTYAQLGNGGYASDGSSRGAIVARAAGDVTLQGGTGNTVNTSKFMYAQIGHGGHQSAGTTGHSGNIAVSSGTGALSSSLGLGTFNDVFDFDGDGTKDSLTFGADTSVNGLRLLGGTGLEVSGVEITNDDAYAMVGHGGRSSNGAHNGNIAVSATKAVSLIGGTAYRSFVQVGHGGLASTGNLSGDISVISETGNLTVKAGAPVAGVNTVEAYALIGHGDDRNLNTDNAGGSRQGRIYALGNHITIDTSDADLAWIGHNFDMNDNVLDPFAAQSILNAATVNLGGGYQVVGLTGLSYMNNGGMTTGGGAAGAGTILINDSFRERYITPNLKDGDFTFTGGNLVIDTLINSTTSYLNVAARANRLTFLAAGDIDANFDIQNPGAGSVNLVAGSRILPSSVINHPTLGGGAAPRINHLMPAPIGLLDLMAVRNDTGQFGQENLGTGGFGPFAIGSSDFFNAAGEISINAAPGAIAIGSANGDTDLMGYGINLWAGDGAGESAQVGYRVGASATNTTGMIKVRALDGGLHLRAGTTGASTNAYAQIGHGGVGANGNLEGELCVHSGGSITFNDIVPGTGAGSYVQIGNGGLNATGTTLGGRITVAAGHSTQGDILMNAGNGADQYVQIGHGGHNTNHNMSGSIMVIANNGGNFTINGGAGIGSYGMSGHGDGRGRYGFPGSGSSSGTRAGGIQYFVDGNATFNSGTAPETSNVYLVHRTNLGGGLQAPGSYLGGDGYAFVVNGNPLGTLPVGTAYPQARENENVIVNGSIGNGNIIITAPGDLTLNVPLPGDLAIEYPNNNFSFVVLAQGNLNFNRSIQNRGSGLVALVAGWDGNFAAGSVNFESGLCNPQILPGTIDFDNCDSFGQNGGVLTIGNASQTEPFAVGSRQGQTILRGHAINIIGSNTTAGASTQIGYRATGIAGEDISGTIDIRAKAGGLNLTAGGATNAFAQIGHGSGSGGLVNDITPSATITVGFCDPGAIALNGGAGAGAYAMIGHGGTGGNYLRNGNVSMTNFSGVSLTSGAGAGAFTQVGHGGLGGSGAITGSVTLSGTGAVNLTSGLGVGATDSYARIGAGGNSYIGSVTGGDVSVTADSVALLSRTGDRAHTQIGTGGHNFAGAVDGGVSVTAATGGVSLTATGTGTEAYSQIGNGGFNADGATFTGAVTVSSAGALSLSGGGAVAKYAMIGHGGRGSDAAKGGLIDIDAASISLTGGGSDRSFAHIGHGGSDASGAVADSGITVDSVGAITLASGGAQAYTQIGHGGYGAINSVVSNSAILINSALGSGTGDILLTAGTGTNASAIIGHGGSRSNAIAGTGDNSASDDVTITKALNVRLTGGSSDDTFAQIGHGGERAAGNWSGNLVVNADGEITLAGGSGNNAHAMIGHGGANNTGAPSGTKSGLITLTAAGNIGVTGGTGAQAAAQIGHGGYQGNGAQSGAISVVSNGGGITVAAGTSASNAYAQVGHGGRGATGTIGAADGTILVQALGNISVTAGLGGAGTERHAQIGHGSLVGLTGNRSGSVTVLSEGDITLQGGNTQNGYVMIGHGGRQTTGDHSGAIEVRAAGSITATAGASAGTVLRNGVQIGHGGSEAHATTGHTGGIEVVAEGGSLTLAGGGGEEGQSRIGHGGPGTNGSHGGTIEASGATGVSLTGGTGLRAMAQIGHGGGSSGALTGTLGGNVTVNAGTGAITMNGGGGTDTYTRIGHGGNNAPGAHDGTISATAGNGVSLIGGGATRALSQIGHSRSGAGNLSGDVFVNVDSTTFLPVGGGAILVRGGTSTDAFAQIGVGGLSSGTFTTSTWVHGDSVEVKVGSGGTAYARIGAGGGVNLIAPITGSTSVNASAGGIKVDASGGGGNAYAQIGAGGLGGSGAIDGSTTAIATGAVELIGGAGNNASAMIGAGGAGRDGNRTNAGVQVVGSSVSLTSGNGGSAFALIGSGGGMTSAGNAVTSDIGGTVSVAATSGNVTLAGGGSRGFAQIGHGGLNFSGATSGDVQVVSAGDLLLTGGTNAGAYALVGHGGLVEAGGLATGARSGNVLVRTGGLTSLTDNSSAAFIGHRGAAGVSGASRLALVTGQLSTAGTATHLTGMIANMIQTGSVEIGVTAGDLLVGGTDLFYDSANHLDLFASGNTSFAVSVQNSGSGAIAGVAGWDGTTGLLETIDPAAFPPISALSLDAAAVEADPAAYANNNGILTVGDGTLSVPRLVGSRGGRTSMMGSGVVVAAGSGAAGAYAQIGYRGTTTDAITGDLFVGVGPDGLQLLGSAMDGGFAQIGHGGTGATAAPVDGSVTLAGAGDATLAAGGGAGSYSLIGHGGVNYAAALSGDIALSGGFGNVALNAGGGQSAFAQVGHGGDGASGAKSGRIDLSADALSLEGGAGLRSVARVGHGGIATSGDLDGVIDLETILGDVSVLGGAGTLASAQIGHGGQVALAGSVVDQAITVSSAGAVLVSARNGSQSSAMIGHGGANGIGPVFSGDVTVAAVGDVSVLGGDLLGAFGQIGHGGLANGANQAGRISVSSGNDLAVRATAPTSLMAYAKIGHGDDVRSIGGGSAGNRDGDVEVTADASLYVQGGLIGHANHFSNAVSTGQTFIGVSWATPSDPAGGNLVVDAAGEISGEDGLRFYLPRRQNNQIAAGARLNGIAYGAAASDPTYALGDDEYTRRINGPNGSSYPNQHNSTLGSGPAPKNSGNFAFYYDTVSFVEAPAEPTAPDVPVPGEPEPPDFSDIFLDDRTLDDWLRDQEKKYLRPVLIRILYEGFNQYGPNGEAISNFNNAAGLGVN